MYDRDRMPPEPHARIAVTWDGQRRYLADILWHLVDDPDQAHVWLRSRAAAVLAQYQRDRAWTPAYGGAELEIVDSSEVERYADVYRTVPGKCFRMVAGASPDGHHVHGQPTDCPEPVVAHGIHVDGRGLRHEVDACAGHRGGLVEWQPILKAAPPATPGAG